MKRNRTPKRLSRHRTENKLAASRRTAHIEKMPCFIYTAEVSSTEFVPRDCTGGFRTLTGYTTASFLKEDFYNTTIVARKDAELLQKFRCSVNSANVPRDVSYTIVTRQGKNLSVTEQVTVLGADSSRKIIGGVVTLSGKSGHSVSLSTLERDRLRFEEMAKLNKHLLEINQLKDEFLANTSHELRTPLNSIIGFLTLITEGYYEGVEELRLFTRNALDSSYHLLSVINDILDVSKIESGKMQLQIEKVYVDELIEEISTLFKVQADQKGLTFKCSLKEPPLFASADLRKLKQVLINLAGNAIKFTQTGGVIVTAEIKDRHVKFTIKDTGIGIPREKQDKLFQKFIQADGSATRRHGGSGLGLVISKHLVEMMGGQIEIESRGPGTGTTVIFTIPKWTKEDA